MTPGLVFTAPYHALDASEPRRKYETSQVGPHIYDLEGVSIAIHSFEVMQNTESSLQELVWSGAGLFQNRPTFDFRVSTINGSQHLSFIAVMGHDTCGFPNGGGVVLDNHYNSVSNVTVNGDNIVIDLHEFWIREDGRSALLMGLSTIQGGSDELNPAGYDGSRFDSTLLEMDLRTNEPLFSWKSTEVMAESDFPYPYELDQSLKQLAKETWDYFHPNSMDKTQQGDFLVSSRHTDSLYLISGSNHSVIWRLGGTHSDFVHEDDFVFSRQHNARIRNESSEGMIISIFDNAHSNLQPGTSADLSSFALIELNTAVAPMTAKILQRIPTPHRDYVDHAGNAQVLDGGNRFINWVKKSYLTEHTEDGELVWEGEWLSERWNTYRAYKANFTGIPLEPPTAKSFVTARGDGRSATTVYVSWNGATEVQTWRVRSAEGKVVAESKRTGFETVVICDGYHPAVYVEAVDLNGQHLSQSRMMDTELPPSWQGETDDPAPRVSHYSPIWNTIIALIVGAGCWEIISRFLLRKNHTTPRIPFLNSGYQKVEQEEA